MDNVTVTSYALLLHIKTIGILVAYPFVTVAFLFQKHNLPTFCLSSLKSICNCFSKAGTFCSLTCKLLLNTHKSIKGLPTGCLNSTFNIRDTNPRDALLMILSFFSNEFTYISTMKNG